MTPLIPAASTGKGIGDNWHRSVGRPAARRARWNDMLGRQGGSRPDTRPCPLMRSTRPPKVVGINGCARTSGPAGKTRPGSARTAGQPKPCKTPQTPRRAL